MINVLGVANSGYFPFQVIAAATEGYVYSGVIPQPEKRTGGRSFIRKIFWREKEKEDANQDALAIFMLDG